MPRKAKRVAALNTADAAIYVGLAESTLEKLRVYGADRGPTHVQLCDRSIRYLIEDLDAWLRSRRRQSTSDKPTRKGGERGPAPRSRSGR